MDFEDFLRKKHKSNKKLALQNDYYNHNKRYRPYANARFDPNDFVNKIRNNKKIKIILLVALVVIIAIIIGVIAIFFSFISYVFSYIDLNGISGLLEKVINFLNNL